MPNQQITNSVAASKLPIGGPTSLRMSSSVPTTVVRPLSFVISAGLCVQCVQLALSEPSASQTDLGNMLRLELASGAFPMPTSAVTAVEPSLGDIFAALAADVPESVWDALPQDLSSNWDRYRTGD